MRKEFSLFLLLLLLPSAIADFSTFGETELTIKTCESSSSNLTIYNFNGTNTYSIFVDGPGSEFTTFSATEFTLQEGAAALISTFYNIPCETKQDIYTLDIIISDSQIEQYLTQQIKVIEPDNINLSALKTDDIITPCQTSTFTLNIQNPLNATEIYHLTSRGHENGKLSETRVTLLPFQEHELTFEFAPQECTLSGTFPFTIAIETEKTEQYKELELETIVTPSDIPEIASGVNKIRTDYSDSTTEISIENTGDRTTTYQISTKGIDWAQISPQSITLKPQEKRQLQLRFTPTNETSQETYTLTIEATIEETGIQYTKDISVNLSPPNLIERNPIFFGAIFATAFVIIIGIIFTIQYTRSSAFKKQLAKWKTQRDKVKKQKEEARRKQLLKREEIRKNELEQRVKAAERQKQIQKRIEQKIERKLAKELKKDYHLIAKKDLIIGKKPNKIYKILSIIFISFIAATVFTFYDVIWNNKEAVAAGLGILAAIFIVKWLSTFKVVYRKWKIVLESQKVNMNCWKKGLTTLIASPKSTVKNFIVLAKKTKVRTQPSPTVYQTVNIRSNAESTFIATFSVSKRFFKKNKIEDLRLAKQNGKGWTNIELKLAGENKNSYFFSAELPTSGIYSIHSKTKIKPGLPITKSIVMTGIIALLIAAAVFSQNTREPQDIAGIPPQNWEANQIHTINLTEPGRFTDPDKDNKLTFSAEGNNHIKIDIVDGIAQLTPEQDWSGEERVIFIATDENGETAESNTVILRVKKPIIPQKYQGFIGIALSFLVIALLLLIARSQKKR